jgi:hypothetical protein
VIVGRYARRDPDAYREPIGVLQGALLGIVGLILAFGLSLAVGRYQERRTHVVVDANTIGTAYLRAQTIAEPQRGRSLELLRQYNDLAIQLTYEVPGSDALRRTAAEQGGIEQDLWRLAGVALNRSPVASAPRLYLDSLNEMIDQQTVRLAGLNNRVPDVVLSLVLLGAAFALGLLALYLSMLGRGVIRSSRLPPSSVSSCSSPSTSTDRHGADQGSRCAASHRAGDHEAAAGSPGAALISPTLVASLRGPPAPVGRSAPAGSPRCGNAFAR